jgi:hypothetical protein
MKKKQILFFGIAVIVITVILTGCCTKPSVKAPTFPPDFTGTWERADLAYPHTLTFTPRTIKASNQQGTFWDLKYVSGDTYTLSQRDYQNNLSSVSIKLTGGNLHIVDDYDAASAGDWVDTGDDWTGIWKRK